MTSSSTTPPPIIKPISILSTILSRDSAAEAISGAIADALTALILFPADVIKARMQTDKTATVSGIINEVGGFLGLYKGMSDKLIVSPQQKLQYFYVETVLLALFMRQYGREANSLEHLIIGYFSALQGNITTIPLDVTLARRIVDRRKGKLNKTFWESFWEAVEKDGFLAFYDSLIVSAILCTNPAITYVTFERIKLYILKGSQRKLSNIEAFFCGALAKAFATIITFPLIRIKTVLNTWGKLHNGESPPDFLDLGKQIMKEQGFVGLYTGLSPQLSKGVLNSAIMLMIKERIDETVSKLFNVGKE
jgi:adenine nucleotide transporter 17